MRNCPSGHDIWDAFGDRFDANGMSKLDLTRDEQAPPPIPAATVVLLRDTNAGPETLLLRKSAKINFGGLWVFPGGRIDPDDHDESGDELAAARTAAAREAAEEAGLTLDAKDFVWMSHWMPPPIRARRFSTWFFVARAPEQHDVAVDGGEIEEHRWIRPGDALIRAARSEIELAPPTWVSLHYLARHDRAAAVLDHFGSRDPRKYRTHFSDVEGGHVAMWLGDAGYDATDPTVPGARHRLTMIDGGFEFDDSGAL